MNDDYVSARLARLSRPPENLCLLQYVINDAIIDIADCGTKFLIATCPIRLIHYPVRTVDIYI